MKTTDEFRAWYARVQKLAASIGHDADEGIPIDSWMTLWMDDFSPAEAVGAAYYVDVEECTCDECGKVHCDAIDGCGTVCGHDHAAEAERAKKAREEDEAQDRYYRRYED